MVKVKKHDESEVVKFLWCVWGACVMCRGCIRRVRHGGEGGESLRPCGAQVLGPFHAHQLPGNFIFLAHFVFFSFFSFFLP